MNTYLTPEELAQQLKVEVTEVVSLIEQGKVRAIRIGEKLRIPQMEVEKLTVSCAAVSVAAEDLSIPAAINEAVLPTGSRWCLTRTRRAKFRVSGSIAAGAEIWPGKMSYPIKFPKQFMEAMLVHFREREIPVGGQFDHPGQGSLGEFIQNELKIKMNPAVYVAALLIEEGYADPVRRGYIRFRSNSDLEAIAESEGLAHR